MAAKTISTRALYSDRPGASVSGTRRILTFVITEEVDTQWCYHWSSLADQRMALCGRETMPTNIEPHLWGGKHPSIPVKWCPECEQLKNKILPDLPEAPNSE